MKKPLALYVSGFAIDMLIAFVTCGYSAATKEGVTKSIAKIAPELTEAELKAVSKSALKYLDASQIDELLKMKDIDKLLKNLSNKDLDLLLKKLKSMDKASYDEAIKAINASDKSSLDNIYKAIDLFSNSAKVSDEIRDILIKNNISIEEFQRMKLTPINELTDREKNILYYIRESIQRPTEDTLMSKVMRIEDMDNYLREDSPFNTVSGYVAKYDDVEKIGTSYSDIRESLRLDYLDSNGNYPYPVDGDSYAVIRFKYKEITDDLIDIPYGTGFYGNNTDPLPCTQNGFLGGTNGTIIPEWHVADYTKADIKDGAEMYMVVNGKEELVAVFKKDRFIKVN